MNSRRLIRSARRREQAATAGTGTRQAAAQAEPYRVISYHDDGDCLGSILGRHCCGAAGRHQDIHFVGTRGQNARAGRKIGFLHPESLNPVPGTLSVSRSVWLRLGYVEGDTVLLRSAEGELSKLPELVAELIRQEIGVLPQ